MPKNSQAMLPLLDILRTETDAEHRLSAPALLQRLAGRGIRTERRSIYRAVDLLQKQGLPVEKTTTGYYYARAAADAEALFALAAAVQAAGFLSDARKLTLFQAMPKSDKMELIVQKAVELGAAEIVPVLTERCVSRPDEKSLEKKRQRWQKIALEAAKQSGRGTIPTIGEALSFKGCIERMKLSDRSFMCYEKGGESLSAENLSGAKSIGLLIGSEGGFEQREADFAAENGIILTGLGKRILRCETAPIAAISIIMSLTGNM